MTTIRLMLVCGLIFACCTASASALAEEAKPAAKTVAAYSKEEVAAAAKELFGAVTPEITELIDKAFTEKGEPVGLIKGEEGAGSMVVGVLYGAGKLMMKDKPVKDIYWQGPTLGVDIGGQGGKILGLVFKLPYPEAIFEKFGGESATLVLAGDYALDYRERGQVSIGFLREKLGLRAGVKMGYITFTPEFSANPF